jgi:hypothetical protein
MRQQTQCTGHTFARTRSGVLLLLLLLRRGGLRAGRLTGEGERRRGGLRP